MRFGIGDDPHLCLSREGHRVNGLKTALQSEHQPAQAARCRAAQISGQANRPVGPILRAEDMQAAGMDIHPIKNAGLAFPGRPFPQVGMRIQDKFGFKNHLVIMPYFSVYSPPVSGLPASIFCWSLRSLAKATSRTASGILLTLRSVQ